MTQIVTAPSEILRKPTRPITTLDKRVINVINDMVDTLIKTRNPEGVGLAAPQIGENLSIFLARPEPKGEIFIFINPEITHYSQRTTRPTGKKGIYEGCLSIPGHYAPVKRAMSVTVKYKTLSSITPLPPLKLRGGGPQDEGDTLIDKLETFSGFPPMSSSTRWTTLMAYYLSTAYSLSKPSFIKWKIRSGWRWGYDSRKIVAADSILFDYCRDNFVNSI